MQDTNIVQIFVQSSKYDADYLEWRINEFLYSYILKETKDNPKPKEPLQTKFTQQSIKLNEDNIKHSMSETTSNLESQSMLFWNQIVNKEYDFQKRQQKINALDNITEKEVSEMYLDIFFRKTKRLNLKLYSHSVCNEEKKIEERKVNIAKN